MRSVLIQCLVWFLFFATTVYGHVALKLATGSGASYQLRKAACAMTSMWGITAVLAWMGSSFLWTLVLTKHDVIMANAISSLRFVLIPLAAVVWLGETFTARQAIGILAITVGMCLLAQKSVN